jgi:transcriptional regulator with XRE-family HTH domain
VTDLGKYLRDRRDELKLTQEQLASEIGVSQATVSQYEQGTITPRPRNLVALAAALKRPPDEVLAAAGFFAARIPGERGPHPTASMALDREGGSALPVGAEPVQRAAQALLARLREWVGPELWPEVLVALQRLASATGAQPTHQAGEGTEQPGGLARPQGRGDRGDEVEIAEVYESREELAKRLPSRLGVPSPSESRSRD